MDNIDFTLSVGCVNNCKCCPQDKFIKAYRGDKIMSFDTFRSIIINLPTTTSVTFSGFCEPYLHPLATEMLRLAATNHVTHLYTTLVGASKEDILAIKDINLNTICIHLPDEYWKHVNPNYALNYDLFKTLKIIHYVIQIKQNEYLQNRAGNLDFDHVYKTGPLTCKTCQNFNNNVVMPNGDVYLCCQDWSLKHKLGNLVSETWEEIHNNENYRNIVNLANMQDSNLLCRGCINAHMA